MTKLDETIQLLNDLTPDNTVKIHDLLSDSIKRSSRDDVRSILSIIVTRETDIQKSILEYNGGSLLLQAVNECFGDSAKTPILEDLLIAFIKTGSRTKEKLQNDDFEGLLPAFNDDLVKKLIIKRMQKSTESCREICGQLAGFGLTKQNLRDLGIQMDFGASAMFDQEVTKANMVKPTVKLKWVDAALAETSKDNNNIVNSF